MGIALKIWILGLELAFALLARLKHSDGNFKEMLIKTIEVYFYCVLDTENYSVIEIWLVPPKKDHSFCVK